MRLKKLLAPILTAAAMISMAAPACADTWWSKDFAQRRKITLDSIGVKGMTAEVKRATVLIRLHSGVLDFTQVKPDGSDLRFVAGDDRTPLTYHIERFDPLAELALIWVDVPAVAPGASQTIWLYYGNQAATLVSNPAATFDGEYSLVAHLNENAAVPVDVTANNNRLTALNAKPTLEGLVAGGMNLAADAQLRASPSNSLHVAAAGRMTWTSWVKPANEPFAADEVIYTKLSAGGETAPLRLSAGLRQGVPYVKVVTDAGAVEALAQAPLAQGAWSHLAIAADGSKVVLYVAGAQAASIDAALPELGGEDVIGASGGLPSFKGDIDEITRSNAARSASQVAFQAQTQGRSSTFASVATEAESANQPSHDYLRILVGALTPDAWVVIGILTVMSIISWFIMVMKGQLLGGTAKANRRFLKAYDAATRGQGAHTGLVDGDLAGSHPRASIGRLFAIGQEELRARLPQSLGAHSPYAIAPQSVAAIRAALDAGHVREEQRLSRGMVLLTIAISGGPFLGLLGTVLGVMITFAGVAAAGEVNINAIAPGIAAALLATVAGLAVAIPALFGYNYLNGRLDNISADNQVFVDELEKRIAETYRGGVMSSVVSPAA